MLVNGYLLLVEMLILITNNELPVNQIFKHVDSGLLR